MTTHSGKYVGIDVSKDRLDVAALGKRQEKQVDNAKEGIAELVKWMLELDPELIVVEATGRYQRAVAVVNPARVRQFARACGLLAKTVAARCVGRQAWEMLIAMSATQT
jgi:transposase